MSPFDREHMTFYYRDLELTVKSQSRSLKVVPFARLNMVSY